MSILVLVFVFFGIGGLGVQIILSMLPNKVLGLIFPVIDLVAIVIIIILGILVSLGILNFGTILIIFMVMACILFVAHSVIYGVTRIIMKSIREKEERLKSKREDAIMNDEKRSVKEEMKKMEIDDL